MKFLSISFSLAQLPDPSQIFPIFSRFPDLAGTISELLFLSRTLLKTRKKKKNVIGNTNSCFAEMKL